MLVSKFCKYDLIPSKKQVLVYALLHREFFFVLFYIISFLRYISISRYHFFQLFRTSFSFSEKRFSLHIPLNGFTLPPNCLPAPPPPHTHTHTTQTHTHTPKQPKSANHRVMKFFSILPLHLQHYMYCEMVLLMLVWYFLQIFLQIF